MSSACGDSTAGHGNTVNVAVLLPFTGQGAPVGTNLEQALIMVQDMVNAAGGINGVPLRLLVVDSASDPEGTATKLTALFAQQPMALIGPEDADTAKVVVPLAAEHQVNVISPYVGASLDSNALTGNFKWFRLAPTAPVLGRALAKFLVSSGQTDITVVTTAGSYNTSFTTATVDKLQELHATVRRTLALSDTKTTYADYFQSIPAADLERLLIVAPPVAAARVVDDIATLFPSKVRHWYFAPTLKTEFFVQNTNVEAVEGGVGVTSNVLNGDQESFGKQYADRWHGEPALEGAFFYYDALALAVLSLGKAWPSATQPLPTYAVMREAIRTTAFPSGVPVSWQELGSGLARVKVGTKVYYTGLTGPIVLDPDGARALGVASFWTVAGGNIRTIAQ